MDRRAFLGTLAGGLLAAPLTAEAQQAEKVYRIGLLGGSPTSAEWRDIRQNLRSLGYSEDRNVKMESRYSAGFPGRLPALATELVQLRVDVIVASGSQASVAAKQATTTIPIVMVATAYPDKLGLVGSLARPGGNVTGLSNVTPELVGKRLELLKQIAPRVSRVAWLRNPDSPAEALGFQDLLAVALAAGLKIQSIDVRTPDDYPMAFAAVASHRAHGLGASPNPVNGANRQLIADFALRSRLPSIFDGRAFVEAGGLISYSASSREMFQRAATYVDKILNGAKPADLPVEQPTVFELVINLKTAKALGLTIPPSLLQRADQVID